MKRRDDLSFHEQQKLYWIHQGIIQRCYNPNSSAFSRYGGRGITVCREWIGDVDRFIDDILRVLGPRPEERSLDRIDNNGHYELFHRITGWEQLRWATQQEQLDNQSSSYSHQTVRR
jgi:hypothetical protein